MRSGKFAILFFWAVLMTLSQNSLAQAQAQAPASEAPTPPTPDQARSNDHEKKQKELDELEKKFISKRKEITDDVLQSFSAEIDIYDGRAYKKKDPTTKKDIPFPAALKCTSVDYRTIHGCLQLRFFDPSARIYFDTGNDDPNEIDIFHDGNLNLTVDLASIYFPWRLGRSEYFDDWSWGPVLGAGIGAAAKDSEDGSMEASDAPIVLFSGGLMLEYRLQGGPSFAFEGGYSRGYTTDESVDDSDDSALYVGLRINVPLGQKKSPSAKKAP